MTLVMVSPPRTNSILQIKFRFKGYQAMTLAVVPGPVDAYPFSAPIVRPEMKYRCKAK